MSKRWLVFPLVGWALVAFTQYGHRLRMAHPPKPLMSCYEQTKPLAERRCQAVNAMAASRIFVRREFVTESSVQFTHVQYQSSRTGLFIISGEALSKREATSPLACTYKFSCTVKRIGPRRWELVDGILDGNSMRTVTVYS